MSPLLSEAKWLDQKRVTAYARVFVAIYAVLIVVVLAVSPHFIDPSGRPVGTDFLCFWTAGGTALEGHAVDAYDYKLQFEREQKALPWKDGQSAPMLPWLYPPMFMMCAALLALLPYGLALGAWMVVTLWIYLAAIRGIVPGGSAMIVALAFPAVLSNLSHGQNGFLTAGLLGGALVLLERRPWVSGILFGLLAYKPQFALLVPLALVVGGYWRSLGAAGLTAVGTVAASWGLFGSASWIAFFATLSATRVYGLEQGAAGWEKLQSIFSAVRMLGGSVELAYGAQAVFAVMAAGAVVWIWHKSTALELKAAVLSVAMLMATPYVLDYDLIVLAVPIACHTAIGLREGFAPWEKFTLLAMWLFPMISRRLGEVLHLPLAPVMLMWLLVVVVWRAGANEEHWQSVAVGRALETIQ